MLLGIMLGVHVETCVILFYCFQMRAPEIIRLDIDINAMEYKSEALFTDEIRGEG